MGIFTRLNFQQFHRQVGTRVLATLALTALLVISSMFLTDLWLSQISQTNAQAVNAYRKVFSVVTIRRLVRASEASQRGYLIAGKLDYLEPYENNRGCSRLAL